MTHHEGDHGAEHDDDDLASVELAVADEGAAVPEGQRIVDEDTEVGKARCKAQRASETQTWCEF